MALNAKQEAFVREYLVDLNATHAATRAGYSAKTAKQIGSRLLTHVDVQSAIAKATAARVERVEITADRVLRELGRIAFADVRNLFTWDEDRACYIPSRNLTDDDAAAISAVEAETTTFGGDDGEPFVTKIKLKLKTYDKIGALDKLARHLGLLVDRVEHTGKNGGPIEILSDGDLKKRAVEVGNRLRAHAGNGSKP